MHHAADIAIRPASQASGPASAARPQFREGAAAWYRFDPEAPRQASFAPGQTLFYDGDEATDFIEIVSGTVRCCRLTPDGRRQIYRFAGPGELLGLGGEEVHSYSAEAVTEVIVRRRPLLSLDTALARDGGLRRRVLQALRDELSAVRTHLMLLGQMSAAAKVASFFLALTVRGGGEDSVHLPMSRADIADYLGLTIETVSRKINELKRQGMIDLVTTREIRIVDPDRLEDVAAG